MKRERASINRLSPVRYILTTSRPLSPENKRELADIVDATHSNGMSAQQLKGQLGLSYSTAWLLAQKLRRSMVDPEREPLEGVIEVDQTEMPFRADNSFFEITKTGRGSGNGGKYEPWRSLGILSWSVPSRVSSARSR
jgi:hypothetical protein